MDMRKLVGRNVKRLRQEKGLTQEQLADLSGFSQQYISGLEQGRRNPTIVSLYELATEGLENATVTAVDEPATHYARPLHRVLRKKSTTSMRWDAPSSPP